MVSECWGDEDKAAYQSGQDFLADTAAMAASAPDAPSNKIKALLADIDARVKRLRRGSRVYSEFDVDGRRQRYEGVVVDVLEENMHCVRWDVSGSVDKQRRSDLRLVHFPAPASAAATGGAAGGGGGGGDDDGAHGVHGSEEGGGESPDEGAGDAKRRRRE